MVSDWLSLMLEEIARRRDERQRDLAEEERRRRASGASEPSAERVRARNGSAEGGSA
jgi:hypothetical protein